jgi:hypothetical protein
MTQPYHFQSLELYRQALDYLDELAEIAELLPPRKSGNLANRLLETATHLVVQIAGKSTGTSEIERSFMVDGTMMSLLETVACLDVIRRRKWAPAKQLDRACESGANLYAHLQKLKKALKRR